MTDNLPNWPGASPCYSRAYALLEHMARNGGVERRYCRGWRCTISEDMRDLITSLSKGDENAIKAALLFPNYSANITGSNQS